MHSNDTSFYAKIPIMNELKDKIKNLAERLEKAVSILDLEGDRKKARELETETAESGFWNNQAQAQKTMQTIANLKKHIEAWDNITADINDFSEILAATNENDHEMIRELTESIKVIENNFEKLEFELLLSGEYDKNDVILTINAGSGGTDAQDWAEILLRIYLRFCEKTGFKAQIIHITEGEEAGIKSASIEIKGNYAYGYLKSEHGVHRLVRISPFDADKARHTSFAGIEVIPEIEETKYTLDEKDLKIDTFRAGGHGGQSVNTTDSAVRITHIPTGTTATCQNERSQLQNKEMALKILKSKLVLLEEEKRREETAKLKGESITAAWGNQIRSYVLHPYNMVKDHRTEYETSDTETVLNGNIDEFIEAYLRKNA